MTPQAFILAVLGGSPQTEIGLTGRLMSHGHTHDEAAHAIKGALVDLMIAKRIEFMPSFRIYRLLVSDGEFHEDEPKEPRAKTAQEVWLEAEKQHKGNA